MGEGVILAERGPTDRHTDRHAGRQARRQAGKRTGEKLASEAERTRAVVAAKKRVF